MRVVAVVALVIAPYALQSLVTNEPGNVNPHIVIAQTPFHKFAALLKAAGSPFLDEAPHSFGEYVKVRCCGGVTAQAVLRRQLGLLACQSPSNLRS
jgi:hypothetical protein